jgi:hypothetical protein
MTLREGDLKTAFTSTQMIQLLGSRMMLRRFLVKAEPLIADFNSNGKKCVRLVGNNPISQLTARQG